MGVRRTVFLVLSSDPERLLRAGLWTVAAASVGESVELLLTAPALAAWVEDRPGAHPDFPSLRGLVEEARALAPVRVVTCDTERALSGLAAERVEAAVDAVESLPSFWRALGEARLVTV